MGIRAVEFWHLPLKWLVTLTTVLRYCAACDQVTKLSKFAPKIWCFLEGEEGVETPFSRTFVNSSYYRTRGNIWWKGICVQPLRFCHYGGLANRRRVTEDLAVKLNRRRRGDFNRRRMSLDQ